MPLPNYGVVCGTYNDFIKEPPNDFGQWYHGFIYVNTGHSVFECAVDVNSPSGEFEYMLLGGLEKNMFTNISVLSNGYHEIARSASSGAIDYIRSPLVKRAKGCLALLVAVFNSIFKSNKMVWVKNSGDEALDKLRDMLVTSERIYVFGAPYTYGGDGIHDIHMNQGDPRGSQWYESNGIWQDGAVIVEKSGVQTLLGYFGKFVTQSLSTDNNGHPI